MMSGARRIWRVPAESFVIFCLVSLIVSALMFLVFSAAFGFVVGACASAMGWFLWSSAFLMGADAATTDVDGQRIM